MTKARTGYGRRYYKNKLDEEQAKLQVATILLNGIDRYNNGEIRLGSRFTGSGLLGILTPYSDFRGGMARDILNRVAVLNDIHRIYLTEYLDCRERLEAWHAEQSKKVRQLRIEYVQSTLKK